VGAVYSSRDALGNLWASTSGAVYGSMSVSDEHQRPQQETGGCEKARHVSLYLFDGSAGRLAHKAAAACAPGPCFKAAVALPAIHIIRLAEACPERAGEWADYNKVPALLILGGLTVTHRNVTYEQNNAHRGGCAQQAKLYCMHIDDHHMYLCTQYEYFLAGCTALAMVMRQG
jgi:hypothetical protein